MVIKEISGKNTWIINSSYNKRSPITSNVWGVSFSSTWGRRQIFECLLELLHHEHFLTQHIRHLDSDRRALFRLHHTLLFDNVIPLLRDIRQRDVENFAVVI